MGAWSNSLESAPKALGQKLLLQRLKLGLDLSLPCINLLSLLLSEISIVLSDITLLVPVPRLRAASKIISV